VIFYFFSRRERVWKNKKERDLEINLVINNYYVELNLMINFLYIFGDYISLIVI